MLGADGLVLGADGLVLDANGLVLGANRLVLDVDFSRCCGVSLIYYMKIPRILKASKRYI